MNKKFCALLSAALVTFTANAAVTVSSTATAGSASVYTASGTTPNGIVFNFDTTGTLSGTANGFTFSNNNAFLSTKVSQIYGPTNVQGLTNAATPVGDTSNFLAIYAGGVETIQNAANAYNTLSLYWGTPDSFNAIDLLDAAGNSIYSITGADVAGLSGMTSGLVSLTSSQSFYGAKFSSSSSAFELDNIGFSNTSASAVPEPASWAMMMIGFGAMGYAMRRRSVRFGAHTAA